MDSPVWDQIYKDFLQGGEAYVTLKGILEPNFKEFVDKTKFPKNRVFDIGYGTGSYLQYLKLHDFEIAGIDNSQTANKMATKTLGEKNGLELADMYEYKIPANIYDFIYSIRTIHHGTKDHIHKLLTRIYEALLSGGYLYITLPVYSSANHWHNFKDKTEIAPGTFIPNSGKEKNLPHSFFTIEEVNTLFSKLKDMDIKEFEGVHHITGKK